MTNPEMSQSGAKALKLTAAPLLVNMEDAARMLGMSKTAFKTHLASGRIGPKPIRFGRSVRFSVAELSDWCAQDCLARERWLEVRAGERTMFHASLRKAQ